MKELDEHSQWEDEWAKAFDDARQAPPPAVWNNIHAVQANMDAEKFRKRAAYYKWIAAASVFMSICSASILFLSSQEPGQEQGVAQNNTTELMVAEKALRSDSAAASKANGDSDMGREAVMPAENSIANTQKKGEKEMGSGLASPADNGLAANNSEADSDLKGFEGGLVPETPNKHTAVRRKGSRRSSADASAKETAASPAVALASETEKKEPGNLRGEGSPAGDIAGDETASDQSLLSGHGAEYSVEDGAENGVHPSGAEMHMEALAGASIPGFTGKKGLLPIEVAQGKMVEAEVRKVWVASNFLDKKKSKAVPRYMLGASVASNNFSANYLDNSPEVAMLANDPNSFSVAAKPSPLANARVTDWDDEQKSVMTVTGALQAAAWLGKKWVLQGGVQYGNYKSESMASSYTEASGIHSYPLHFSNYSEDKVEQLSFKRSRAAEPVSATNSFQFLSVPLSIGYVVVDGKLSLLLTPGISSDFFLGNKLSAEGDSNLSTFTVSNGEASPFSFVHFKGLIGAQLFYRMSDNYIISLEPAYQQAISDFSKSDSFFSSRPTNISVAAGFKYIFH